MREYRSEVIFILLLLLSLLSLGTGTESTLLHNAVKRTVSITAFPFHWTKDKVGGGIDYALGFFSDYNGMRQENETHRHELTRLKQMVAGRSELERENNRLREMITFVRESPEHTLEAVNVIASFKGTITIDRGARHGVKPFMGVISEEGVVGMIIEVNTLSSIVATLHHNDCHVGAMVKRNRVRAYDGIVRASTSDLTRVCTMEYIDTKAKQVVQMGDLVVTSPESLFPAGIPIGVVISVHGEESLLKWAEVLPNVDPYRLDEVFLIHQSAPATEALIDVDPIEERPEVIEALRIAGRTLPPLPISLAPELPQDQPLPDYYAP